MKENKLKTKTGYAQKRRKWLGNRKFSPARGKGLWWEGCVDK